MGPMCGVNAFCLAVRSALIFNHASLDRTVGLPSSWCLQTNINSILYLQEAISSLAAMSKSAWGSVALMGLSLVNLEITDRPSQASQSIGLCVVSGQKVRV